MSRDFKFFLIGLIIGLPLLWGAIILQKNLEDFLFWGKIADSPDLLTAQIIQEQKLEQLKLQRNWQAAGLQISAASAISVFLDHQGNKRILFSKESQKVLPIASLSKLMAADVILENYDLSQEIEITEQAVATEETAGGFTAGEVFFTQGLLYSSLIESSNDATAALIEVIGETTFVNLMNLTAENLGLKNTYFVDAIGLDPDGPEESINRSTAEDMANFSVYLLENKPRILGILSLTEFDFYAASGVFHHTIKNTNELLGEVPGIIAGKTGKTPIAGGCLIIIMEAPAKEGKIVNVILGSTDRFGEMKKLIGWLNAAYKW
jgi:D-alanyl-D-alanine carboxypeptidase